MGVIFITRPEKTKRADARMCQTWTILHHGHVSHYTDLCSLEGPDQMWRSPSNSYSKARHILNNQEPHRNVFGAPVLTFLSSWDNLEGMEILDRSLNSSAEISASKKSWAPDNRHHFGLSMFRKHSLFDTRFLAWRSCSRVVVGNLWLLQTKLDALLL